MTCLTAGARFGSVLRRLAGAGLPAALAAGIALPALAAAPSQAEFQQREAWRAAIAHTPVPQQGCFKADYPQTAWTAVRCTAAPTRPYLPRHAAAAGETVGNGNDYAAVSSKLTSSATGSFPVVTGLKKETGFRQPNTYSLQLNSGFMKTAGCKGSANSNCLTWLQYVYSSSSDAAFMQYWLINYGSKCPAGGGWNSYSGSCYKNSAAVSVPLQVITQLGNLKVSGSAVAKGLDTLVLTTAGSAYSTTGPDSVVYLAKAWKASEFNVIGDGGGSSANFNKGTSITVQIALSDHSTLAPTCAANAGTTGETNNLTLQTCAASGGSTPAISFVESR